MDLEKDRRPRSHAEGVEAKVAGVPPLRIFVQGSQAADSRRTEEGRKRGEARRQADTEAETHDSGQSIGL